GSLEKAWRPYHASFDDNIDEVTSSIVNGTKANVVVVSLTNLDATISLLNAVGKEAEAKDLLDFFAAKKPIEFWDRSDDPFSRGPFQLVVEAVIAAKQAEKLAVDAAAFNPEPNLIKAGKSYDSEVIKKLAEVPVDEYLRIFKTNKGDELAHLIY